MLLFIVVHPHHVITMRLLIRIPGKAFHPHLPHNLNNFSSSNNNTRNRRRHRNNNNES